MGTKESESGAWTSGTRGVGFYTEQRSHQGSRTQGRTPTQAFADGLALVPVADAA
jgi:hypothetical protein